MSIGLTKDDFTTAEAIVVQHSSEESLPQDEGEDLIQLLEDEEGEE